LALVVERESQLVGFLFGFVTTAKPPVGYIHLLGIHPEFRRRGIGRLLYAKFEEDSRGSGCGTLKAMTTPGNETAMAFHRALGFNVELLEDYAGPGRPRIVFAKDL